MDDPTMAPAGEVPTAGGAAPDSARDDTHAQPAARGASSTPPAANLGRYQLLRKLGQGGMGVVWLAHDPSLGRQIALKEIRAGAASPAQLQRFQREARLSARLRHPGIVAVHELGECDGRPFLAMDYVPGTTLRAWWSDRLHARRDQHPEPPGDLSRDVEVLARVAEAVAYAHAQGVLHRDLKPENVLIGAGDQPVVMDFGLACLMQSEDPIADASVLQRLTQSGQMLGTPGYMSPEQVRADGAAIDGRTDVWALGVMLYELLTGHQPFRRDTPIATVAAVIAGRCKPPRERRRAVPPPLDAVCQAALQPEPAARTASAAALAADLRRWLRGEPVLARAPGFATRGFRAARRQLVPIVAIAAAALIVVTALWWREARRAERTARLQSGLAEVTRLIDAFEDTVGKLGLAGDAQRSLADQSLTLVNALVADTPEAAAVWSMRARLRERLGELDAAQSDYDRACALAPDQPAGWYWRGRSAVERYARTRGLPAPRPGYNGVEFAAQRDESTEETRWREQGLADLERMSRLLVPSTGLADTEARLGRALLALHTNEPGHLDQVLELAAGIPGPRAARVRGSALYLARKFAEAVAEFSAALEQWPCDVDTRVRRGLAYEGAGQGGRLLRVRPQQNYEAAIADFTRARELDAANLPSLRARARVRLHFAEAAAESGYDPRPLYEEALADTREVLASAPDDADARILQGRLHVRFGRVDGDFNIDPAPRYQRALDDFNRVLAAQPQQLEALFERSGVFLCLGIRAIALKEPEAEPFARALADLDATIAIDAEPFDSYGTRGAVYSDRAKGAERRREDPTPDLVRAIADYTESLQRRPDRLWQFTNRGHAHARLGEYKLRTGADPSADFRNAEADYRQAIQDGDPFAWLPLGHVYRNQGRLEEARAAFLKSAEILPQTRAKAAGMARGMLALLGLRLLDAAEQSLRSGAVEQACGEFDRGFARLAEELVDLPEAEQAKRREAPNLRRRLASAHYNAACAECLRLAARPGETPLADPERALRIDRAFAHLDQAFHWGYRDRDHLRADPDLTPLHDDPRFAALLARTD